MADIFSTVEHDKYKKYKNIIELGYGNADQEEFVADYEARGGTQYEPATGASTTTPEVTTPGTVSMTPGLNELVEEIGEGNIPDDVLDIIDPLRNPTEKYGIPFLKTKFGELDPEKQGKKLSDKWFDLYNTYGMEPDDPNIDKIMDYLRSMRMKAESGKQISRLSPDQQGGLKQWWRELDPKLSDFSPVSSAMAGELSSEQMAAQRARMKAETVKKAAVRKQAAESMAQAGVTLSGSGTVTPAIKTTAPGQSGGYQYQDTAQDRQEQREQERQAAVERTSSRVSPSGKVRAYGLQEGGMVDEKRRVQDLGQNAGILGLGAFGQNPHIQNGGGQIRQPPPQGGWNIQDILGGGPRNWPPRTKFPDWQGMGEQIGGFGETLGGYGEQLGGYEEQLGGFGEQIGGFGEQMSGVEEAMGGFSGQFDNLNNKLDSMEKGIASLSDQMQPKQPQFGGYGGGFGYRGRYG